ncbi:lysis system i-spanin subunit Rz [Burkholderia cenocepacia]|uniref:lysis system i-spanin subunit Rz n=1 Tax=Burkholderia cenocepacia TaxID=95486 RepID=UPI002B243F31|nr:lysis system i-spanin subunit Rz [Burkholderia cenocepacia]MEB2499524.1 lysis system i-spanin subunit Rz [Burkholderia cenocepacia]MEB2557199.1 lysis system i-spanin subunit Rz [Burkholderia cenocepacia]
MRVAALYVLVALIGAAFGVVVDEHVCSQRLATERAARASDNARHATELGAMSKATLDAEQRAIAAHDAAATRIAESDARLYREREAHESDSRAFRDQLATGAQRLRVAVSNCSADRDDRVSGPASAASMGDGTVAYADLDRATAQRVFGVAERDQSEIDKLRALQDYVCAVRPATTACTGRNARNAD